MMAMQRHAYDDAANAFRRLLEGFPRERALLERVRVYLDLCEREQRKAPRTPVSREERMTAATAALNNDDDREAERLARTVLAEDERNDLALYLLAALEARRGMTEEAMTFLSQAVALSPDAGALARQDDDFSALHGTDAFRALTKPPPLPAASIRRSRRSRAER
jgi:tetratricopeptide (TPR) repeat protein